MLYDQYFIDDLKDRADLVRRLCFAILLSLGLAFNYVAQEPSKPVLVDEHGLLPCDDSLGRIDLWYAELSNHPGSRGLAVISTQPDEKHKGVFYQGLMEGNARFRGASEALSLKYIRSKSEGPITIRLWLIPNGAVNPEIENIDETFEFPAGMKPFLLGSEPVDYFGNVCPSVVSDREVFSKFLKGNPNARGNIVVRDRTVERARRKAEKIRRDFSKKYQISPSRLRFFPRKKSVPTNYLEPIVEYWYLP